MTDDVPEGMVVANDSDYKRTHLLIHQSARLPSPCFLVTNVDASIFPALRLPDSDPDAIGSPDEKSNDVKRKKARQVSGGRQVRFDRILCDVPCSGDGTIRKNVGIWKYWNPMDGNGLHGCVGRAYVFFCGRVDCTICVGVKIASADPAACDANAASGRPDCVLDLLAQSDRK